MAKKPKLKFKAPKYNKEMILNQHSHNADIKIALWAIAAIVIIVLVVSFVGRPTGAYVIQPLCREGQLVVESSNDAMNLQQYQGFTCSPSLIPSIQCCSPPLR